MSGHVRLPCLLGTVASRTVEFRIGPADNLLMNRTASFSIALAILALLASLAVAQEAKPAIPSDGDNAAAALAASTRHGEWADVALPGGDTKIKSWVVYPERADKAPVVLVIHEIFGMTDWVRGVADQLAAEGFIAVAPDLLSGKGPGGGGTESFEGDKAREAIRLLQPDEVTARLNAVRDYALALPAAGGKTGVVGFCWGGSQVWNYAVRQPGVNAAVAYYGSGPTEAADYAKITCPVLGLYGSDDARVNATIETSEKAMSAAGKSYSKTVFEGAGHGFLRQQTARDGANQKAATAAWTQTLAFFKKNLQ